MKLTTAIAGAYYGSKIKTNEDTIGKLVGVFSNHICCNIELPDGTISIGNRLSDCQLILTPIAEVSAEHGKAIAQILRDESDEDLYDEDTFAEWMEEIFSGNCCTSADYVSGSDFRKLIAYCQRNSIDVGYDEIPSLIEAGIAIKSEA